jgi:hypothetical protein
MAVACHAAFIHASMRAIVTAIPVRIISIIIRIGSIIRRRIISRVNGKYRKTYTDVNTGIRLRSSQGPETE